MPPVPPTYRKRLRIEGATLAACGAMGTLALLVAKGAEASSNAVSSAVQLGVVAVLLAWLGPLSARRAMDKAEPVEADAAGTGQPTALWKLPLIVALLATPFALFGSWDASLRVTLGCVLVGLAQAVLLEDVVARRERTDGGSYVRLPGSRIVLGTRLGLMSSSTARAAR
jgi:hypothetical protein